MPALDTNVLVRYLVADDARQARAVRGLVRAAVAARQPLYVPVTVTLELEWVLRTCYGFAREQVIAALSALLSTVDLTLESEAAVEGALALYEENAADFSDCLHVALAHVAEHSPLWTFDRRASRLVGARLLPAT